MAFEDRFRFSTHGVFVRNGRVLMLRDTYRDRAWGLPGGAVEHGETVRDALVRECAEELGVAADVGPLTGIYYHAVYESQVCVFRCSLPDDAGVTLSPEHSEHAWVAVEDLDGVQRRRVEDAIGFTGQVSFRAFSAEPNA